MILSVCTNSATTMKPQYRKIALFGVLLTANMIDFSIICEYVSGSDYTPKCFEFDQCNEFTFGFNNRHENVVKH